MAQDTLVADDPTTKARDGIDYRCNTIDPTRNSSEMRQVSSLYKRDRHFVAPRNGNDPKS